MQSFKLRVDAALQRIQTLDITFDDISVVHFLMGLHDRYQGIVDTLCIKGGELTLDSVYREVVSHEQRTHLRKGVAADSKSANAATISDAKASTTAEDSTLKSLHKQTALLAKQVAKLQKSNTSGGSPYRGGNSRPPGDKPSQRVFLRDGLDNTRSKYPDTPTPWERTQKCSNCNQNGHIERTCKRSKKADNDGSSKRVVKFQDKGGKRANLAISGPSANLAISGPSATDSSGTQPKSDSRYAHALMMSIDSRKRKTPEPSSCMQASREDKLEMIVDSGCSGHMSGTLRPSDCDNIREVSEKIRTADGTFVPATQSCLR